MQTDFENPYQSPRAIEEQSIDSPELTARARINRYPIAFGALTFVAYALLQLATLPLFGSSGSQPGDWGQMLYAEFIASQYLAKALTLSLLAAMIGWLLGIGVEIFKPKRPLS